MALDSRHLPLLNLGFFHIATTAVTAAAAAEVATPAAPAADFASPFGSTVPASAFVVSILADPATSIPHIVLCNR
jgi:hypothetical protein